MSNLTNTEKGALRALLKALRVVASENLKGELEQLRPRVAELTEQNNRYVQERNGLYNNGYQAGFRAGVEAAAQLCETWGNPYGIAPLEASKAIRALLDEEKGVGVCHG